MRKRTKLRCHRPKCRRDAVFITAKLPQGQLEKYEHFGSKPPPRLLMCPYDCGLKRKRELTESERATLLENPDAIEDLD